MEVFDQLREWAESKTVLRLRVHGKEYPAIVDEKLKIISPEFHERLSRSLEENTPI